MAEKPSSKSQSGEAHEESADPQAMVDQAMADAQAQLDEVRDEANRDAPLKDEPQAFNVPEFTGGSMTEEAGAIDLLGDVELDVTIELGRSEMRVEDVLRLGPESVIELDKLAGDPVDVYVNNRLVARGEVLVLNDNFCIRISQIVADLQEQADEIAQQQQQDEDAAR